MTNELILDSDVLYLDDKHQYFNELGQEIPSVSELIHYVLGAEYEDVSERIMSNAQRFGTDIHLAIQKDLKKNETVSFKDVRRQIVYENYLDMKKELKANNLCEVIVDYRQLYAGRIDLLSYDDKTKWLVDIKTSSKLMSEHLKWQLGFYSLALKEMGVKVDKCFCMWLPKTMGCQFKEIEPYSKEECLRVLNEYLEHLENLINKTSYA